MATTTIFNRSSKHLILEVLCWTICWYDGGPSDGGKRTIIDLLVPAGADTFSEQ